MGRSVLFCLHLFNSHPWWNFQHGALLGVSTQASAWMLSPRQVCVGGSGANKKVLFFPTKFQIYVTYSLLCLLQIFNLYF